MPMYKIKANMDKQFETCGEACSHFYSMCGPRFCSMKIARDVRGFAAKQNAKAGMKAMSDLFKEKGREIYLPME